jgi:hypothetical protein
VAAGRARLRTEWKKKNADQTDRDNDLRKRLDEGRATLIDVRLAMPAGALRAWID